jgi:hypothetical protein
MRRAGRNDWVRAALVGGSGGPTGWTISDGRGAARPVTLEALMCVEHQLRANGDAEAADDLYRQITTLCRVAEAWRHVGHDRRLEEASVAV